MVVGLAVGAIGWLLFERAESGAERAVFLLGALALAGGAAAALRVSPLAVGLVAGLFWTVAPGRADRIVQDDLAKVQHPLVVLLLVTAGALWAPSVVGLWLLAPYLLFRLAGKVAGAWVSARIVDVSAGGSRGVSDAAGRARRGVCAQLPPDCCRPTPATRCCPPWRSARRRSSCSRWRSCRTGAGGPHVVRRLGARWPSRSGSRGSSSLRLGDASQRRRRALALGVALIAGVDRRLAVRVPPAAAHHRLLIFGLLCGPRSPTSSPSRWRATFSVVSGFAIGVIAFIAGLQLNLMRPAAAARRDRAVRA